MGTALAEYAQRSEGSWQQLNGMYRQWSFFRGTVDNAELALSKVDMEIVQAYGQLMQEGAEGEGIGNKIAAEYECTC